MERVTFLTTRDLGEAIGDLILSFGLDRADRVEVSVRLDSCGGYGLGVGVVTGGGIGGAAAGFLRFMSIAIAIMTITAMIAPIMP